MSDLPGDIKIGRYAPGDLDAIMEIEGEAFTAPWSRESYEELSGQAGIDIWVARQGGELIGYMLLQSAGSEMELHTFAVKAGRREAGIGGMLMEHMLSESRSRNVKSIFLQVRPTNSRARALYAKFGFKDVGVRKAYYADNREDALVMRLEL